MKKILAISGDLGSGGAERVLVNLLNHLSENNDYKVDLLVVRNDEMSFMPMLSSNVNVKTLGFGKGESFRKPKIIKLISKVVSIKPDVLFVNNNFFAAFISLFGLLLKLLNIKVVWRLTLLHSVNCVGNNSFYKLLFKIFSRTFDAIVTQSQDMTDDLLKNWSVRQSKVVQINNPVDIEKVTKMSNEASEIAMDNDCKNYVMAGRLLHQKGYDILIERLLKFQTSIKYCIYIMGKGPLKDKLEQMIEINGLADRVKLLGFQANPYSVMAQSDGFILSSRYEGFPNVLLEANVLGVPVFSNRCPGGINEIVIEGVNGLTSDMQNQDDFNKTFVQFMTMSFDSHKIVKSVETRYSFEVILPQYDNVFKRLLKI